MSDTTTKFLAVDAKRFAELICVSVRSIRRLQASGKLPPPVRIGGSVRWLVRDIEQWLEMGRPDRRKWLIATCDNSDRRRIV